MFGFKKKKVTEKKEKKNDFISKADNGNYILLDKGFGIVEVTKDMKKIKLVWVDPHLCRLQPDLFLKNKVKVLSGKYEKLEGLRKQVALRRIMQEFPQDF